MKKITRQLYDSRDKAAEDGAFSPAAERFVWHDAAGITVSGPDDGEVLLTWEEFNSEPEADAPK